MLCMAFKKREERERGKMASSNHEIKLKRLCNFDVFYILYIHRQQVMNNSTLNVQMVSVEIAKKNFEVDYLTSSENLQFRIIFLFLQMGYAF
jgi:hypothetical protein